MKSPSTTSSPANPQAWVSRLGWLLGIGVPVMALVATVAWLVDGVPGVQGSLIAGGICLPPGLIAVVLVSQSGNQSPLVGMLVAMLFRVGLPMAACLLVYQGGGFLAEAHFAAYMVPQYLAFLALETWLVLPELNMTPVAKRT